MKHYLSFLLGVLITSYISAQLPEYEITTTTVTDTSGYLYDSGGKNSDYFPDTDDAFTITVGAGKKVYIRFIKFALEPSTAGQCLYDYLEIYDGANTSADLVGTYCGANSPGDFVSTSESVTIRMIADGGFETTGFEMFWTDDANDDFPEQQYCDANGADCSAGDRFMVSVGLNDMYNQSSCSVGGYSDFTDKIATVEVGGAVTVNVGTGVFGNPGNTMYGWIDWNQNKVFEESEALVFAGTDMNFLVSDTGAFVGLGRVPNDAVLGLTRMRLRYTFLSDPTGAALDITNLPCGFVDLGEVEDYTVLVTDPDAPLPACPTAIAPLDMASNQCTELLFQWNSVADADTFNLRLFSDNDNRGFQKLSDTSLLVSNLDPNTDYQWIVEAVNENGTSILCDTLSFSTGNLSPEVAFDDDALSLCANEPYTFMAAPSEGDAPYSYTWTGTGAALLDDASAEMPNLADNTPGTYTLDVTVSDARGCASNTASQEVEIKQVQQAEEIVLLNELACNGEAVTFLYNANFNAQFQDSDDSLTFTDFPPNYLSGDTVLYNQPTVGKKFLRAIVTVNGCTDTSEVVTQERLGPLDPAEIDFFAGEAVNCPSDEVAMQAANYNTGITWSNGATTDTITITESGSYSYTFTDANGCSTTSDAIDVTIVELDAPLALNVTADTVALCEGEAVTLVVNNENAVWNDANNTANDTLVVTTEGLYKATVTKDGCAFVSDSVFVKVNPRPAPIALDFDSEQSLCAGIDSLVITGVEGMEWTVPAGVTTTSITVFESGSYFGSITNEFGCTALSDTADVVFNEAPAQPEITREDSIVFVAGAAGNARIWILDGTNISVEDTIELDEPGEYQVVLVSPEGCISDTSDIFLFDPNSIQESLASAGVQVYPVPTTDNTVFLKTEQNVSFRLIAADGRMLENGAVVSGNTEQIALPSQGYFFLQVSTEDSSWTVKLLSN